MTGCLIKTINLQIRWNILAQNKNLMTNFKALFNVISSLKIYCHFYYLFLETSGTKHPSQAFAIPEDKNSLHGYRTKHHTRTGQNLLKTVIGSPHNFPKLFPLSLSVLSELYGSDLPGRGHTSFWPF
jgi:hypothetical protein